MLLHDGRRFSANSIVIATGVRRRKLGVPGEDEFSGRGILESGVGDRDTLEGKDVVIVGGGDAAIENAAILGERARKIIVVHRRTEFGARAELIERALSSGRVEFVTGAEVPFESWKRDHTLATAMRSSWYAARGLEVPSILGRLIAEGWVERMGKSACFTEGVLKDAKGAVRYAELTYGTGMVMVGPIEEGALGKLMVKRQKTAAAQQGV